MERNTEQPELYDDNGEQTLFGEQYACYQMAITNTGYRESGREFADTMNDGATGMDPVVANEYRRLCRYAGITPDGWFTRDR